MIHIFILGHSNEPDGRLSAASEIRISFAISIFQDFNSKNQPACLLATGGFGDNFNISNRPHHLWVEDEIKRRGLSQNLRSGATLNSSHTVEDAVLIKKYCRSNDVQSFLIVTNEFHLVRSQMVFRAIFNPVSVTVLASENPSVIENGEFVHEKASIDRLKS